MLSLRLTTVVVYAARSAFASIALTYSCIVKDGMDDTWEADGWEPDDQFGGLAAATRFPLQPGMALDVFFNKPESGAGGWKPGYYRGIVDSATKPTKQTKSQTVEVDFPGDLSSSEIKVTEKSILPAGTEGASCPSRTSACRSARGKGRRAGTGSGY